jgi:hypothetical protein
MNTEPARARLAARLSEAMTTAHASVESLSDHTKVPRATIRSFLAEPAACVLPSRVYLRGHFRIVAKHLGLDDVEAVALFDAAHPEVSELPAPTELPRVSKGTIGLSMGLLGFGILAVVLSLLRG